MPYGWPLKPFDRAHPIRGSFNDPRIAGKSRAFHFGVDVAAKDGTAVYAVTGGKAHVEDQTKVAVESGGVDFGYWHIKPVVKHHQQVARHQLIGHIIKGWGHVHFAERRGGEYVDPLRAGAMGPWSDPTSPRIAAIALERNGKRLDPRAISGAVDVIVEAYDRPPLAIPDPDWADSILTPAYLRWRVMRGAKVARAWHTPIDFRHTMLPQSRFAGVYAPGTRQNHPRKPGRYRFFLAHTWTTRKLADGRYRLEAEAVDERGNSARAGLDFTLANNV
jgi:murein DD-endopeptidase MepM/ murein hydrolase activator NlpD